MALTPEQIKAGIASLTPSDVKKAVPKKAKPLIEPSTTTTTTEIAPQITSVQPLTPKQNIMSPSLDVQAGIQPNRDYKSIATTKEKIAFQNMLNDGLDPKHASETLKYAIDKRLTQENNARGQEPKKYVDQNNMPIYNGDLSLKGGVQGVQPQFSKGEWNDQLIPQADPTFAYTEGDIAKGGTTGFKNLGKMIGNAPASIYNVGANVGNMILNPIDTAEGLASLVGGVATKGVKGVVNALGGDGNKIQSFIDQKAQEPGVLGYVFNTLSKGDDNASMLADALVDRYGSIDKLTKTVVEDPAGFVSDVSTIVGGASSLASKGAKVAGKTQLASNLQKVSTAMDVIDPYTQIPKAVNKAALSVAKPIAQGVANVGVSALGKMTGTSADTIKQVYKSAVQGSDEARAGLRGNINDQDVLTSVQRGVEAIKDDRNLAYGNDYKILKANTNKLDIRNIGLETLQSMYDDLGVSVDKQGKLDFSQSKITSKAAQSNLQEIITDMKNWKDKTPAGLDILKQRVQDYYRGMPEYAKSDRFSTMVSNKIKDLIVKEVPEYAKMQENYGKMQSILSDIKSAISVGGKAGNSTIITKLKGVLRDNQEFRQAMVRKLEEYSGKDVMGQIAGLQMNPVLPKGLVGAALGAGGGLGYLAGTLTNPATLLGLLGTSPRLVGEFANAVGVSVNLINKVVEKAKSFIPDGNNGGSNSPSVLSKLNPTPDGGNNMKTPPLIPTKTPINTKTSQPGPMYVPPVVPKRVVGLNDTPIIPTKTVTMDTKVVAPKETVVPKNTPVKQEVAQSTTVPKKQSVLPKPQEKQAVLEGKKQSFDEYFNSLSDEQLIKLKGDVSRGILGRGKIREIWSKENPGEIKKTIISKSEPNPEKFISKESIKIPNKVYRGISKDGPTGTAKYGQGLYTASTKKQASAYGEVKELGSDAIPKNPIQFKTELDFNQWEYELSRKLGIDKRDLYLKKGVEDYIQELGYDGLTVGPKDDMYIIKYTKKSPVPTPKAPVSKELQPLYEEAKKYKTADEFVNEVEKGNKIDTEINIDNINKEYPIYKRDMQKAFNEIGGGTARNISQEPIRAFYDIHTGKYNVIDGYHRIANAVNKGLNKIKGTIEYEYSGGGTIKRDEKLRKIREEAQRQ